jgi:hypothetical protein
MPSMSYCMFENTTIEMSQIIDAMQDARSFRSLRLNEYEQDAYKVLYRQCKKFIELHDDLPVGSYDDLQDEDDDEFEDTL